MQITLVDIIQHIEKLVDRGIRLNNYVEMLEELIAIRNSDDIKYLNFSPAFFTNTMDSFTQQIIIELANLLIRSRGDRRSLLSFFNRLEQFCGFNPNQIPKSKTIMTEIALDRDIISSLENIIENVKSRRDQFHAHMDPTYFDNPEKLVQDYPLSINEVRETTDFYTNTVAKYYSYICQKGIEMKLIAGKVSDLIGMLKEYDRLLEEEIKRLQP